MFFLSFHAPWQTFWFDLIVFGNHTRNTTHGLLVGWMNGKEQRRLLVMLRERTTVYWLALARRLAFKRPDRQALSLLPKITASPNFFSNIIFISPLTVLRADRRCCRHPHWASPRAFVIASTASKFYHRGNHIQWPASKHRSPSDHLSFLPSTSGVQIRGQTPTWTMWMCKGRPGDKSECLGDASSGWTQPSNGNYKRPVSSGGDQPRGDQNACHSPGGGIRRRWWGTIFLWPRQIYIFVLYNLIGVILGDPQRSRRSERNWRWLRQ